MPRVTTVLFAEDNPTIRTMVARVLERRGCRVLSASDGVEALELFRQHLEETDVVALDVRMPNLEGPQALTQMRLLRPKLPAVLMSGFADSNSEITALLESGVRFVPKPFRAASLADLICELAQPRT